MIYSIILSKFFVNYKFFIWIEDYGKNAYKNLTSSQSINQSFVYCRLLQRSWIAGGDSTLNYNIKHNNIIA